MFSQYENPAFKSAFTIIYASVHYKTAQCQEGILPFKILFEVIKLRVLTSVFIQIHHLHNFIIHYNHSYEKEDHQYETFDTTSCF